MSKIPIGKDGIPIKKRIPETKRRCPLSATHPTTGRLLGDCHEAKIIGILTKMGDDESIVDLMNRKSRITVELEKTCPHFDSCKLVAKVDVQTRVNKDEDGNIIDKEQIPIKRLVTSETMTLEETVIAVKRRRRLKSKSEDFIGKAAKKRKLKGVKKQSSIKGSDGEKILVI